jgi:tetratricopeptide (TPR) repeat protein
MSSENAPQSAQLSDAINSIAPGENAEQEILKLLLDRISVKDPVVGEVIRYCAIPRRFSAEVIGVLRQAPDDRETNEDLLSKVLRFSSARRRPDGTYKYNETTRQLLLQEWRLPDKREQFDQLNQHLVDFYKEEYERTASLEPDLIRATPIIQHADSTRLVQITSIFQRRLVAPLLEALYQKSLISAEACYKYFERLYQDQEAKGRLIVCESLVMGTRDCLERLPADSGKERWFNWLQYWKARLKREYREDAASAEILREMLPQIEGDTLLKIWVLGDLGAAYYQQSKLQEAGAAYKQVIELATTTGEDPYNLPIWYHRLAQLYWALEELGEAEQHYIKAIALAKDNVRMGISAQVDLAGVLYAEGRWEDALNTIIETLDLTRTKLPADKQAYRSVLEQLMNLLARRHPQLLDTIFHEAKALMDSSDPLATLRFTRQYLALLRQSGQLDRADEQLKKLTEATKPQNNQLLNIELKLEEALLLEEQGRLAEAIAAFDEVALDAANHESGAWYCAAAVSNRGMDRAKLGLWKEAEADLEEAIKKWEGMSHDKLEGFMESNLATVHRQQGRLAQAQQSLDRAFQVLSGTQSSYLNDLYREQAEVFRAQGLRQEARVNYQTALDRFRRLDYLNNAAQVLAQLATLASEEGDWSEATLCANQSAGYWQELARSNSYSPTEAAQRADEENAESIQELFADEDDRLKNISKSRDLLLLACEEVPENFWYRLNLAYACAELENWSEASEAIGRVLSDAPKWLRTSMLYDRLADYRARQGKELSKQGQYAEAAEFYTRSHEVLDSHVSFERLAEVELGLGDSYLRLEELDQAQVEYQRGLTRTEQAGPTEAEASLRFQAAFHGRLGLVEVLRSSPPGVLDHFRANISLRTKRDPATAVEDLITLTNEFSDVIKTTAQYRTLGEALRAISDDPSIEMSQRQRLIGAQLDLSQNRYRQTRAPSDDLSKKTATDFPVFTPIVVEADARLFPLHEATPEVNRMIQVDIPAMRQELMLNTGVNIPGVRVRSNDNLDEGVYILSLDEVPMVSGRVYLREKFCADYVRCNELEINGQVVINPADGTQGMWLPESSRKQAEDAGLQLMDPYQFMIFHLGSLVGNHLESFLGVQEVDTMLAQWNADDQEEKRTLLTKAIPDDKALVNLAQVLQHLGKEHVPVRNLLAILTAFAEANPNMAEVIEVTEKVRLALRSDLPVNKQTQKLIGLSPEFEAVVARCVHLEDGKRFLALPFQETRELMGALSNYVGDQNADRLAIIVRTPDLRPFVWRFVYANYPSMLVSAEKELVDGTRLPEEQIAFPT